MIVTHRKHTEESDSALYSYTYCTVHKLPTIEKVGVGGGWGGVFANLIFAKLALILQCLPSSETKTASEY
jgi:hypothetical protein